MTIKFPDIAGKLLVDSSVSAKVNCGFMNQQNHDFTFTGIHFQGQVP